MTSSICLVILLTTLLSTVHCAPQLLWLRNYHHSHTYHHHHFSDQSSTLSTYSVASTGFVTSPVTAYSSGARTSAISTNVTRSSLYFSSSKMANETGTVIGSAASISPSSTSKLLSHTSTFVVSSVSAFSSSASKLASPAETSTTSSTLRATSLTSKLSSYTSTSTVAGTSISSSSASKLTVHTSTSVENTVSASASSFSSTSASPSSTPTVASGNPNPNFIRGINIGGWLLIDQQLNQNLFSGLFTKAVDQWTFDTLDGAADALENHWQTYFNEGHVQLLKSYGLNALRIPIGFWAYDATGTPYYSQGIGKGADAYLEKAVGWAKAAGMKVWIDCHGSPGSQNGYATSGHQGSVEWQQDANQAKSIAILEKMAAKYGAAEYEDTVIGLELVNEPISWGANTFAKNQQFAKTAYAAVRAQAANKDMAIVMHDAFEGPANWTALASSMGPKGSFVIDTHMYQTLTAADRGMTQGQHIMAVCERGIPLEDPNQKVPVIVGEWTATTQVCVTGDGVSTAGTSCGTSGCACVTDPSSKWTPALVNQMRRYVEAQLEIFDSYTSGYFLWSWTDPNVSDPSSWSIVEGMKKGVFPNPLNDMTKRLYPGQCDA